MPVIYSINPSLVPTPLQPLLERIATCAVHIAPEKEKDLAELMAEHQWHYEVSVDDGAAGFAGDSGTRIVKLPLAQLERLWALVYGFLTAFDLARKHYPKEELIVDEFPQLKEPMTLLWWADTGLKKGIRHNWPSEMPRPDEMTGDPNHIEKINRFFLGALSFITLHEIAHIVRKHPSPKFQTDDQSIQCEKEADRWATQWIFSKCPQDSATRIFRANCCTLALSMINFLEVHALPQRGKITHPPTVERILELMDFFPESTGEKALEADFPLYLAAVILHVQRVNLGFDVDVDLKHESITDYLINALRAFREKREG